MNDEIILYLYIFTSLQLDGGENTDVGHESRKTSEYSTIK